MTIRTGMGWLKATKQALLTGVAGFVVTALAMGVGYFTGAGQARAPAPEAEVSGEMARSVGALRDEVGRLRAQLSSDEEMMKLHSSEIDKLAETERVAQSPSYRQTAASPWQHRAAVANETAELNQKVDQMKALSEYLRQVATSVGALDAVMSNPQALEKRAAELQKAGGHP
jgi:hypothetical protein